MLETCADGWRAPVVSFVVVAGLQLGGLVSCGGPEVEVRLDDDGVLARFEQLHRHVYGAYGIGADPDALHRWLGCSFAGEALTEEYVEQFVALRRMESEHTSIDIVQVDYETLSVGRDRHRLWVDADWSVGGVVTHQGHRHPRINRYRARYALQPVSVGDGVDLRITETVLLSQERQRSARTTGFPLDELPQSARGSMSLGDLLRTGVVTQERADSERPGRRDDEQ